jgi:5-methylcytosine-specific restriction endonuclease McrA
LPDVSPDPKPVSEGGIGRKKPPRGWRTRGRKMATREEWAAIIAAKGYDCRLCAPHARRLPPQYHHLVPRARGGDDVADNIVPLCEEDHAHVTRHDPAALKYLAASLTDGEHAYIVGKLGEGGMGRLFGV